jgi:hypothetical protein
MRLSVAITISSAVLFASDVSQAWAGEVSGPFANRITPADVQQIKGAVSKNGHVSHNVKKIEAIRPDKVAVQTRIRAGVDQDTVYDFMVAKHAGTWAIDENSIQITTEQRDFRTNGPTFVR